MSSEYDDLSNILDFIKIKFILFYYFKIINANKFN